MTRVPTFIDGRVVPSSYFEIAGYHDIVNNLYDQHSTLRQGRFFHTFHTSKGMGMGFNLFRIFRHLKLNIPSKIGKRKTSPLILVMRPVSLIVLLFKCNVRVRTTQPKPKRNVPYQAESYCEARK